MAYQYQEWPKVLYGPDRQSRVFNRDDQIPSGWEDHPDKVKEKKSKKLTPEEKERVEAIRELRANGVQIDDDATVEEINAAIDRLTEGR